MIACKSDPEVIPVVDPVHGNELSEPYNIGLIEVTKATAEGKTKMRNGLRWLLQRLEQHRMYRSCIFSRLRSCHR